MPATFVLLADVPVTPDRPTARRLVVEELSRPEYAHGESVLVRLWRWFVGLFDGVPSLDVPPWQLILGLLAAVVVVVLVARRVAGPVRLARARRAAAVVAHDDARTADQMRAEADDAAARGDWATAVTERFRAVVRRLEERTLLDEQPGRTAQEAADAATARLPGLGMLLRAGARVFDAVVYGDQAAEPDDDALLRELDDAARTARAPHATVVGAPGTPGAGVDAP